MKLGKLYKSLLLSVCMPALLSAQKAPSVGNAGVYYDIQLAGYTTPKMETFKAAQPLGYVFERQKDNGISKVYMGTFADKEVAAKLDAVRKKGYKDAFSVKLPTNDGRKVYVVQLGAYDDAGLIVWSDFKPYSKDICVMLTEHKVRIMAGPYLSQQEAEEHLERIGRMGNKTVMVKEVHPELLHTVTAFEMGLETKPALEMLDKKNIVDLQKVLKSANAYQGALNGELSDVTMNALEAFKQQSRRYQNALTIVRGKDNADTIYSPEAVNTLQYFVDNIGKQDNVAADGLKAMTSSDPMAKVYLAYMYLSGRAATPDMNNTVNNLMREATQSIFKTYKGATRYDFSQKYAYEDVAQWTRHLKDIQLATYNRVTLPCILFKAHAAEMQEAFAAYWNNEKDNYKVSENCDDEGVRFEELLVLQQLSADLDPLDALDVAASMNAALSSASFSSPMPLAQNEVQELNDWHRRLLSGLEKSTGNNPLQRRMVNNWEVAYYEARIKVEYYFLKKELSEQEAQGLTLRIIKNLCAEHLQYYLN